MRLQGCLRLYMSSELMLLSGGRQNQCIAMVNATACWKIDLISNSPSMTFGVILLEEGNTVFKMRESESEARLTLSLKESQLLSRNCQFKINLKDGRWMEVEEVLCL